MFMNKAFGRTLITLAVASTSIVSAQGVIGIRSSAPGNSPKYHRQLEAARPLLGYVTDGSNVLRSVVGSAGSAVWGEPLSIPGSEITTFLPPRQEYVLLSSNAGLSVARLSRSTIYPGSVIPGAMPHPDRVAFSPSGEAAALFSQEQSRIEVLSFGAQAHVLWSVPANGGELLEFAIADDNKLLVVHFANQPPVYSLRGAPWQPLSTNYQPAATTFLPHSHDLVLSDRVQKAIVLLPDAGRAPVAERLLAIGTVDADLLLPNKETSRLLAVQTGAALSWSIDLTNGAVTPLTVKNQIDSLTLLRDGQTFLLSTQQLPVVLNPGGAAVRAAITDISR